MTSGQVRFAENQPDRAMIATAGFVKELMLTGSLLYVPLFAGWLPAKYRIII